MFYFLLLVKFILMDIFNCLITILVDISKVVYDLKFS